MHYWLKSYRCELLAVLAVARTHAISLGLRVRGWIACPAGTPELQSCLSEGHGFTGCGKNSVSGRPGIPRRSEHCPRRKCSPIMGPETGENGFSRPSGTRNLSLNTTQDCVLGYFQVAPSGLELQSLVLTQALTSDTKAQNDFMTFVSGDNARCGEASPAYLKPCRARRVSATRRTAGSGC